MKRLATFALIVALLPAAEGSWYWPFSSSKDEEKPPRVSELMEPASIMIDEAYDLSADGKTSEAVAKFREALAELDRIAEENPDRMVEPEFNTLKNKRATVTAAIDSLLLAEAESNAKAITVSDTTELQKKYDEKKYGKKAAKDEKVEEKKSEKKDEEPPKKDAGKPKSKVEIVLACLAAKDYDAADAAVKEILAEKPDDAAALNLKSAVEIGRGDLKAAERALDQAIMSNPRSYYAYYNMARLMLRTRGSNSGAKRYYETGRMVGGPVDSALEELLK